MKLIIVNQNNPERLFRAIVALVFLGMAAFMEPGLLRFVSFFSGLGLMFNAITGNCYFYRIIGYSSCPNRN
tara:strand:- start:2264 stop:2476 length:213 start_codon:yes stop_codon:yes gene_type:complete